MLLAFVIFVKSGIRGLHIVPLEFVIFVEIGIRGLHIMLFSICDFRENRHKRSAYNAIRIYFRGNRHKRSAYNAI